MIEMYVNSFIVSVTLPLTQAGGKLLQEGMEENKSLLMLDLRLTEISQESEYCINQAVKDNQDRVPEIG